jgi:hypothetical protein
MKMLENETKLMEGDNKQIILTSHRIRQEYRIFGKLRLKSIMLEHITSCEYDKKSNPLLLIIGILAIGFGIAVLNSIGHNEELIGIISIIAGTILIIAYLTTIKKLLYISSPSAKILINTDGMKDENIIAFIDRIEEAKNDRLKYLALQIKKPS